MYDPNSPFLKTATKGLSQQEFAFARLHSAIVECELEPGEEISEARLTERFGMQKAAIRAALMRLSMLGLVQSTPRRGWRVAPVVIRLVRAVIDARRRLEPVLAEVRLPEKELRVLRSLAATAAAAGGDALGTSAAREIDRQILDHLAALTGNDLLQRWLSEVWDHAQRIETLCDPVDAPDREPLIEALAAGRRTDAATLLNAAIDRFESAAIDMIMGTNSEIYPRPRNVEDHGSPGLAPRKGGSRPAKGDVQQ